MADDEIVQGIRLTGVSEVVAGFAAIAKAGQVAFAALSVGATSFSVGGMVQAVTGVAEAFALATAAVVAWDQALANSYYSLTSLAQEFGTTAAELGSLKAAITSLGANTDNIGVTLRRLATRTETEFPLIQKAMRETAIVYQEDAEKVSLAIQKIIDTNNQLDEAKIQRQKAAVALEHGPEDERERAEKNAEAEIDAEQKVEDVKINNARAAQDRALKVAQLEQSLKENELESSKLGYRLEQEFALKRESNATSAIAAYESLAEARYKFGVEFEGEERQPEFEQEFKRQDALIHIRELADKAREASEKIAREGAEEAQKREELGLRAQQLELQKYQIQIEIQRTVQDNRRLALEGAERQREAEERLREAQEKRAKDTEERGIREQQLILDVRKTRAAEDLLAIQQKRDQTDLDKAQIDQREHAANDVTKLKKYFDDLAKGGDADASGLILSVENMTKGIIASLGGESDASKALGTFKKGISAIAGSPTEVDTFLRLSDILHNLFLIDPTKAEALATTLFGRGYGQDVVRILSEGRKAIEDEQKRLAATGLLPTDKMIDDGNKLKVAFSSLGVEIGLLGAQFASAFSPATTAILDSIRTAVEASSPAFIALGENIASKVTPAIVALTQLITGKKIEIQGLDEAKVAEWTSTFEKIEARAKSFGTTLQAIWHDVGIGFSTLRVALNFVADTFNKLAGTHITGAQLGIDLLIGQFLGITAAIVSVIATVGRLSVSLIALAAGNPVAAVFIAGIAAVIALIVIWNKYSEQIKAFGQSTSIWDTLTAGGIAAVEAIKNGFQELFRYIDQWGQSTSIWDAVVSAGELAATVIKAGFDSLFKAIEAWGQSTAVWDTITEAGTTTAQTVAGDFANLVSAAWRAIQSAASSTFQQILGVAESVASAIAAVFTTGASAVGSLTAAWAQFTNVVQAWLSSSSISSYFADVAQSIESSLSGAFQSVVSAASGAFQSILGIATGIAGSIASAFAAAIQSIASAWATLGNAFNQEVSEAKAGISGLASFISSALSNAWGSVVSAASSAFQQILGIAESVASSIASAFSSMLSKIASALNALSSKAAGQGNLGGSGSPPEEQGATGGFASGGLIGGRPGTDTNIIAATRGEYVMSTPAVDHWGTGFMSAINSRTRDSVPGYASGGYIGAGHPGSRVESGSRNSRTATRSLTLNIGGQTFGGLSGPEHVVDALETYAAYMEGVSAGTPPSWLR